MQRLGTILGCFKGFSMRLEAQLAWLSGCHFLRLAFINCFQVT
jgi:hypothetical protein